MQINKNLVILSLMLVAVVVRFMNILPNFSPVVGMTLFGAALLNRKVWAFILPLVFIYGTDLIINNTFARSFYPEVSGIVWFSEYMIWNFVAYAMIAGIGVLALNKKVKFSNTLVLTLAASVVFYFITNMGAWLDPKMMYPSNFSGLILSLEAALPFFRTSIVSDLLWSGALFGTYYLIKSTSLIQVENKVVS